MALEKQYFNVKHTAMIFGISKASIINMLNKIIKAHHWQQTDHVKYHGNDIVMDNACLNAVIALHKYNEQESHPDLLYLIEQKGLPGIVKIGITKNFKRRWKTLSTAAPIGLRLIALYSIPQAYTVEQYLHKRYKKDHSHLEWYRIDSHELKELVAGISDQYKRIR